MLSIIAAIGKNRELGRDNKLLWHISGDLPRFKQLTTGHPVIMGRKTFESIGKPLPGRTNIVISSHGLSPREALHKARVSEGSDEIFVIGGGKIYKEFIDMTDRLYLTVVDQTAEADTFFPDYSAFSRIVSQEQRKQGELRFSYLILERE